MPLTTDIRAALEVYVEEHGAVTTAAELSMSRVNLWRILNGQRWPRPASLDAIGELLGLRLTKENDDEA